MSTAGLVTSLSEKLGAGDTVLLAWCCLGLPHLGEAMLREGYDAALFDMQHGAFDFAGAVRGIELAALAGKPSMARIPVGEFATAQRLLDNGASGIVAPMINSAADARAFAANVKFPPMGERSWGPSRTLQIEGRPNLMDFLARANKAQLAIAMIETREALEAIDDILAVPGIDGVLLGPADLSIALTDGARVNAEDQVVDDALDVIAGAARRAGKIASSFCGSGQRARKLIDKGFRLVSAGLDISVVRLGAKAELAAAQGGGGAASGTGY